MAANQRAEVLVPLLPGFFLRTLTGPEKRQKQQNLALGARSRPHFHRSERTGQIFRAQKRCLTKSSWIHHRSSRFHWYPSLVKSSRQIWTVWTSSFFIWRVLVLVKAYAFEIFSRPPSGLREIFSSVLKPALFRTTQVVKLTGVPQEY